MARSKKRLKKKVTFTLLLFLLIIAIGGIFTYEHFKSDESPSVIDKVIPKVVEEPKDEVYKISLFATGDGLIHNSVAWYAKTNNGYDFTPFFTEIKEIVKDYDLVYYNQETTFGTKESEYSFYPTFSVPSEYGDAMVKTGFNLISLASNHSYDKGEAGVLRSLKFWQDEAKDNKIIFNGIADSEDTRNNYQIGEINNITYAMLSYTYGLNGFSLPSGKSYLVNVFDYDTALQDIEYLRDKVDLLIVAMHWGEEYNLNTTNTQKEQAKWLAEHDVDIVIGNHSHCVEPVEWIDDTPVIYSLGNFISNQGILRGGNYVYNGTVKGTIGAYATLDITKTITPEKETTLKVDNLNIDLLYTYRNDLDKYYQILPFSKMNDEYLKNYPSTSNSNPSNQWWYMNNYQETYELYKAIIQKYDSTINVLPLANN